MSNQTLLGNAPKPATIDKAGTHLLAPVVDGIIRRFNDDESRAEAALSAVALLQTLKAMGTFNAPPQSVPVGGTFVQPSPGVRPVLTGSIAQRLEDELKKSQADTFERRYDDKGGPAA